jgi:hypothetical protein
MNDDMRIVLRHVAGHFNRMGVDRLDTPFDFPGLNFESKVAPALRRLAKAQPPYLEGVQVAEEDYPAVITGLTERGWEAMEASGDSPDSALGDGAASVPPTAMGRDGRVFHVALSFADQQRHYVREVARGLSRRGIEYFYDAEQEIRLWGRNLGEELQRIYMDDSFTVVMFISNDYAQKVWTTHERKAILSRALRERREYVLPVRFDDVELAGLNPDLVYLRADEFTPDALAEAIAEKIASLGGLVPGSTPADGNSDESIDSSRGSGERKSVVSPGGLGVANLFLTANTHLPEPRTYSPYSPLMQLRPYGPGDLKIMSAVQLPTGSSWRFLDQSVTKLRGEPREDLLMDLLEESDLTEWLREEAELFLVAGRPSWDLAGPNAGESSQLAFRPLDGPVPGLAPLVVECRVLTGWVNGPEGPRPSLRITVEVGFHLRSIDEQRQPWPTRRWLVQIGATSFGTDWGHQHTVGSDGTIASRSVVPGPVCRRFTLIRWTDRRYTLDRNPSLQP